MDSSGSILVVDDNSLEVLITKKSFTRLGLKNQVVYASDGQEAIELLETGIRPSLILLDINMPKMNGIEFLRKRKANPDWASIPVVIFSSSKSEKDLKEAYKLGIAGYMVKPIDFEEMTELLRVVVNYWSFSEQSEHS